MAITQGAHHIGLTVPNIEVARDFFVNVLAFQQVGEVPDYPAYFVADGTIIVTLWQATDPVSAIPFNRKTNIGLHHLALKVKDIDTLNSIYQTLLKTEGVEIEFEPELSSGGPSQHMIFYIPGGIRMELMAPGN